MINDSFGNLGARLGDRPIDLFICSASYEDRCKCVVDSLNGIVPNHALVAMDLRLGSKVSTHCEYLKSQLGDGAKVMTLDSDSPITTADNIMKSVECGLSSGAQRIVIDTTTFTRESLLILLRFLRFGCVRGEAVEFLYTHAKEYSFGDKVEDKWLSKGVREVRSVLGYSGDLLPSRRNHLIILVGFEEERAINLINQFEPAKVSLGVADWAERGTVPHQGINTSTRNKLRGLVEEVSDFTFMAYDAEETWRTLKEEAAKATNLNTIVAPLNTKISTIGAAMFCMENEAVQVCYAQPNIYNYDRYSVPDNEFYLFSIDGFPR